MKNNLFQSLYGIKKLTSEKVVPVTYTPEKRLFAAANFKDF